MSLKQIVYVTALAAAVAITIALVPEANAASKYRVLYNFYGQNGFPGPKGGSSSFCRVGHRWERAPLRNSRRRDGQQLLRPLRRDI
jgi:hypothetical protein